MALPKQVEDAAEAAEKYMESLDSDESTPSEEVAQEEPSEKAVTTEDETSIDETQPEEESSNDEEETFKSRYETLQGKYDAEVPRLHSELKELKENIFGKIDELAKTQNEKPEPVEDKSPSETLARLKEEAGEDFADILLDVIREEITPVIESNVKTVDDRVNAVEETQVTAAQSEFVSYLDEHIDSGKDGVSWQEAWAGNDPNFVKFIEQPDPSGLYTYGQLIEMYNKEWNAEGLSKVFNIYYGTQKPAEKAPPQKKVKSPEEEAMIAPSRDTQHVTPDEGDKRIWTGEDIETFKREDRAGKYKPEQSKAMWDDLLAALAENRIQ